MDMITKIYLVENCYGDPNKVYIGKTKNSRENPHKQKYGKEIIYTEIDIISSFLYEYWEPLETYWIEQFRQWGFEVMNKRKKGGSGPECWTDEQKLNAKGKKKPTSGNRGKRPGTGRIGIPQSDETKQKISQKNKNRALGPKGYKYTIEQRIKISKGRAKPILQYNKEGNFIKEWSSIKEAQNTINGDVWACCTGLQKTAGGFIFKYKDYNG